MARTGRAFPTHPNVGQRQAAGVPATLFWLHLSAPAEPDLVLPSGYMTSGLSLVVNNTATAGPNARKMDEQPGTGQVVTTLSGIPQTSGVWSGMAQFCSAPLDAQTLPPGVYTLAIAVDSLLANSYQFTATFGVINGATGIHRGSSTFAGTLTLARTTATETTMFVTYNGTSATVLAGDYLVLEILVTFSTASGQTANLWTDGTVPITANAVGTANAGSYLQMPTHVVYLPTIAGSGELDSGSALAAAGIPVGQTAGSGELDGGSALAAVGIPVGQTAGSAALSGGSALAAAGIAAPATVAASAGVSAGSTLAAAGAAHTITTLYLSLANAAPAGGTLPSGYFGSGWNAVTAGRGGANALALRTVRGGGQTSVSSSLPTAFVTTALAQFISDTLGDQTVPTMQLLMAFGLQRANNASYRGVIVVAIIKPDGTIRAFIVNGAFLGGNFTSASEVVTLGANEPGFPATITAGDRLVVECGVDLLASAPDTVSLFTDGTVLPTTNLQVVSDVASFITIPVALVFAVMAVATLSGGSTLDGAGSAVPAIVSAPAELDSGSALAAFAMLPTMAIATLAGGSQLAAPGSVGGASTGSSELDAGSALDAAGTVLVFAITASGALDGGSTLAAAGTPSLIVLPATGELDGGSTLAAVGAALAAIVTGSGELDGGSALAATGASQLVVIDGTAALDGGSALAAPPFIPVAGTAALAGGAMLSAPGSVGGAVTGSSELDGGSTLAAAGAATVLKVTGAVSTLSGASVQTLGTTTPVLRQGTADVASGATLAAVGSAMPLQVVGTAALAAGATLLTIDMAVVVAIPELASFVGGSALAAAGIVSVTAIGSTGELAGGSTLAVVGTVGPPPVIVNGTATMAAGARLRLIGLLADTGAASFERLRTMHAVFSPSEDGISGVLAGGAGSIYGTLTEDVSDLQGVMSGDTHDIQGTLSGDQTAVRGVLH